MANGATRTGNLLAAALLVALASSGCLSGFSEVLPTPPVSTLAFACAVLDGDGVERVRLASYQEADGLDPSVALAALASEVALLAARPPGAVTVANRTLPEAPAGGWNATTLGDWARQTPFLNRNQVTLRILWLTVLDHPDQMGLVPAPGAVALSQTALETAALRLNRSSDDVVRAALLHFAGHALGATNRGIPVQDPDLQVREGSAGHDADPASVLAAGWEDARSVEWVANATYDRYPGAAHADWHAARGPGGVCT